MKDFLNKCGALVLTYDLCMSQKNEEIFSMTDRHCEGMEHGFFHIGMPATTGTDGKILDNVVNVLVKILVLKKRLSDSPAMKVQN